MHNRKGLCWLLCVIISPTTRRSCSDELHPLYRATRCLSADQESQTALFSSGWVISGSASFCSCSKSKDRRWGGCAATALECLYFRAGGVQWAKKPRPDYAYFAYSVYSVYTTSLICFSPQPGQMSVNLPSSTSTVNTNKSCMSFQSPPCWDSFLLFQWAGPGQYPLRMLGEPADFPGALCNKPKTVAMDVGDGMWTAGHLDGGPRNSGNKQQKTLRTDSFNF